MLKLLNRINFGLLKKQMKKSDLEAMALDDLWALHEQISSILSSRIVAEKQQLERRLVQLGRGRELQGPAAPEQMSDKTDRDHRD